MLNANAKNGNCGRYSLITDPVHQNSVFEMILRSTPDWQIIASRIVNETPFIRRRSYRSVATVGLAPSLCSRDKRHAGLCCSDRGRLARTILRPCDWKNVVHVDAYGRRLRAIYWISALVGALTLLDNVVADCGPTMDSGAVNVDNLSADSTKHCCRRSSRALHFLICREGRAYRGAWY